MLHQQGGVGSSTDTKKRQLYHHKGKATVIMNTTEYREKMTDMVGDTNMYTRLSKGPMHKYKNRVINILRD